MTEKQGWYIPNWSAFTIVDEDGNDIPVAAARLHTDNEQIYVHYQDQNGKKHQNAARNDVAGVVIWKPFKVVPRPGYEHFAGRHQKLSNPPKDYAEATGSMAKDRGESDLVGWDGLDFTPAWVNRIKNFFIDLRSR